MKTRALDINNDFTFGRGKGNYKKDSLAVAQNIQTNLALFKNECFFDMDSGVDWYNLLGYKDLINLRLAIATTILNTENVLGLRQLNLNLDRTTRKLTITYSVQTVYSTFIGSYSPTI